MARILAVITTNRETIAGGAPIFIAGTEDEKKKIAFRLEKILDASVHDLLNGQLIVVERD